MIVVMSINGMARRKAHCLIGQHCQFFYVSGSEWSNMQRYAMYCMPLRWIPAYPASGALLMRKQVTGLQGLHLSVWRRQARRPLPTTSKRWQLQATASQSQWHGMLMTGPTAWFLLPVPGELLLSLAASPWGLGHWLPPSWPIHWHTRHHALTVLQPCFTGN